MVTIVTNQVVFPGDSATLLDGVWATPEDLDTPHHK